MRTRTERKLRVTDCLLLVAATAVGLAVSRTITPSELTLQRIWESASNPINGGWSFLFFVQFSCELSCELLTVAFIPSLAAWTLACLMLRHTGPRPPWRRLSRQPGGMACLIATAALGLSAALGVFARLLSGDRYHNLSWLSWQIMIGSIGTGLAILWCWVTMSLSGCWRPEPSWLDRLGRLLGLLWMAVALMYGYANLKNFYL